MTFCWFLILQRIQTQGQLQKDVIWLSLQYNCQVSFWSPGVMTSIYSNYNMPFSHV